MTLTPAQCRAARGFLNWTLADLAEASGISRASLNAFERGNSNMKADTMAAIQNAFDQAGMEFLDEYGVQQRGEKLEVRRLSGPQGVRMLQDEIFEVCRATGSDILFNGLDETKFGEVDLAFQQMHIERLRKHKISEKVLLKQGDRHLTYPPDVTTYRWLSPDLFGTLTSVIYGDRYGVILWGNPIQIVITHNRSLADTHRQQFEFLWQSAQPLPFSEDEIRQINEALTK